MSKVITLPVTKGLGKSTDNDYVSLLPVNMLTIPPKLVTDSGFMRSFPGIVKDADVAGVSRGALYNPADNVVYRVLGKSLYKGGAAITTIDGSGRVSMASSPSAVAIAAEGVLSFALHNGTMVTLDNWPEQDYYVGRTEVLKRESKASGYDGSLYLSVEMVSEGHLELTLTPKTNTGAEGEPLVVDVIMKTFNQEQAAEGTPYLTDVIISGFAISGTTLTVSYTFNLNGASGDDVTLFEWLQIVEPTTIQNTQYNLGKIKDVAHANGRFAWIKDGTNELWVSDLGDQTKPDRARPMMQAQAMPDLAVGVAALEGNLVVFGTVSTETFTLTGSSDTTKPVYQSQRAMMVPVGIAGPRCKVDVGGKFAILSHPATGSVSIYLVGSGSATEIASRVVVQALSTLPLIDLEKAVLEYLNYDIHKLLIIHVGERVFCYDFISKAWAQLCTGNRQAAHTSIDYIFDGSFITLGDIKTPVTGHLDRTVASQYGQPQEHILYTPMISVPNARLYDMELETASGAAQYTEHLAYSATVDGVIYGVEKPVLADGLHQYNQRVLLRRVAHVRRNIGFRFRSLTRTPLTISSCKVRIS